MKRALRGAVLPILLLAAWEIASHSGVVDSRILPSLELVAQTAFNQVIHEGLLRNLAASLSRDMVGFTLGALIGIVLGTVLGFSRIADRAFMPSFNGLRQIAILAWIPLISIWFGVGEAAKIVFIMAAALIPVVQNTYEGMRGASTQLIEVARTLTFTRWLIASINAGTIPVPLSRMVPQATDHLLPPAVRLRHRKPGCSPVSPPSKSLWPNDTSPTARWYPTMSRRATLEEAAVHWPSTVTADCLRPVLRPRWLYCRHRGV